MSAARTTISMPESVYQRAVQRQQELGYDKFSDYIQALLRADGLSKEGHIREVYQPNSPGKKLAGEFFAAAVEHASQSGAESTPPKPPARPVKYSTPRRSKKTRPV